MKRNIIYLLFLILSTAAVVDINSNGSPSSSTGAPGEVNCTTSGCHDDFLINTGGGITSITIANGVTEYTPGQTYSVTVSISQSAINRFGFQVVALADKDNSNAGTFNIVESGRTQIIPGSGTLSNRNYITYTFPGTAALNTGYSEWTFEWTAPASNEGSVTFFLAAIAGNDDGTDSGDKCYLNSLTLTSAALGVETNRSDVKLKLFPDPINDEITVCFTLEKESSVKMQLHNTNGQLLKEWFLGTQSQGTCSKTLNLEKNYPQGIYFFTLLKDRESVTRKFFID